MKRKSFTLLEILIAIGIVAILAGIIVGGVHVAGERSDEARTLSIMKEFEMALDKYKADKGAYPVQKDEEEVNFNNSAWKKFTAGKYLKNNVTGPLLDGYDNPFYYRYPGKKNPQKYDLWSKGADGLHGSDDEIGNAGEEGSDDICNWRQ